MIPDSTVQAIKDAAKIEDVVSRYIDLKKSGSRFVASCPFHEERTPSFHVTPSKGIYKCFGCGKGGDAIRFVMEYTRCTYPEALKVIAAMYNITTDSGHIDGTRKPMLKPAPKPKTPPPPPTYIPKQKFRDSLKGYDRNNFASFLIGRFGPDDAAALIGRYLIGTSNYRPGANVFWYMDTAGHVRTGKVMLYDPVTGKRSRTIDPIAAHAKNLLNIEGTVICWYGEHLLRKHPAAPVGIVESEKTAIIASLYLPNMVWLAAGGREGLAAEKWPPLRGRKVLLFPDADPPDKDGNSPFSLWSKKAEDMGEAGYMVKVSDLLERKATPEQRAGKWDLADYLLQYDPAEFRAMSASQQPRTAQTTTPVQIQAPRSEPPTTDDSAPDAGTWQSFTAKDGTTFEQRIDADGLPAIWSDPRPAAEAIAANIRQHEINLCEASGWTFEGYEPLTKEDIAAWHRMMQRAGLLT